MKLENCATMETTFQIEKRFCNYALKEQIDEVRDDLNRKAGISDVAIMA